MVTFFAQIASGDVASMSEMLCKKQARQWSAMVEGVGTTGMASVRGWLRYFMGFCIDCSGSCLARTVAGLRGIRKT